MTRLCDFASLSLLVRLRSNRGPTDTPAPSTLFADARCFESVTINHTVQLAASGNLNPLFLPQVVAKIKPEAPLCRIQMDPLVSVCDDQAKLTHGALNLVIGNWPRAPKAFYLGRLFDAEVARLVAANHPAARRGWYASAGLLAGHMAPSAKGVIDNDLDAQGLRRNITMRGPHFGLIQATLAPSLLIFTKCCQHFKRFTDILPVKIFPCPLKFPRRLYDPLRRACKNNSASAKWLRAYTKSAAPQLVKNERVPATP